MGKVKIQKTVQSYNIFLKYANVCAFFLQKK